MSANETRIVQLTTVHPRNDIRVRIKECGSLGQTFPHSVRLVVADGLGDDALPDIEIVDLGALPKARLGRALHGFARALKYLHATRPTVVHFHDPELIPVGLIAKCLGIRVVYDVHEDVPRQIMGRTSTNLLLRLVLAGGAAVAEWLGSHAFDAIVPATPKIAERFPPRKTVLVQNFPLLSELVHTAPRPYDGRPASFVYVGGISRMRGLIEMADAVGRLEPVWEARLELAGKFSPASLHDELASNASYSRIKLHGWMNRKQVAELLAQVRAGLVVLHPAPNHVDSQPNKLFEYMAAGLPVIASDFPLWRQIIDGVGCGLLVDPLDPDAIADAMRWILGNPQQAEAMGQRGREAVERTFNWNSERERLIALYRRLLGSRAFRAEELG